MEQPARRKQGASETLCRVDSRPQQHLLQFSQLPYRINLPRGGAYLTVLCRALRCSPLYRPRSDAVLSPPRWSEGHQHNRLTAPHRTPSCDQGCTNKDVTAPIGLFCSRQNAGVSERTRATRGLCTLAEACVEGIKHLCPLSRYAQCSAWITCGQQAISSGQSPLGPRR